MTVTATAPLGLAVTKLVTHISNSTTFQAACGVAAADAALAHIHCPWGEDDDNDDMPPVPFCVITPQRADWERVAGGAQTVLLAQGDIKVLFGIANRPELSLLDNFVTSDNVAGGTIEDLRDISGVSNNLNMTAIRQIIPHCVTHHANRVPQQNGQAAKYTWMSGFSIDWGAI